MKIKPDVALDTNGASFKIVLWKTTAVVFKVARNSLGTQLWKDSSVFFGSYEGSMLVLYKLGIFGILLVAFWCHFEVRLWFRGQLACSQFLVHLGICFGRKGILDSWFVLDYFGSFLRNYHLKFNLRFKLNQIIFGVHSWLMEKSVV